MKVKDLKELLNGVDDNMDVLVCANGESFEMVNEDESGIVTFGEPCNEDGSPIEDLKGHEGPTVFALIS